MFSCVFFSVSSSSSSSSLCYRVLFRQSHGRDGLSSVLSVFATAMKTVHNPIDTSHCMTSPRILMKIGENSKTCAKFSSERSSFYRCVFFFSSS